MTIWLIPRFLLNKTRIQIERDCGDLTSDRLADSCNRFSGLRPGAAWTHLCEPATGRPRDAAGGMLTAKGGPTVFVTRPISLAFAAFNPSCGDSSDGHIRKATHPWWI